MTNEHVYVSPRSSAKVAAGGALPLTVLRAMAATDNGEMICTGGGWRTSKMPAWHHTEEGWEYLRGFRLQTLLALVRRGLVKPVNGFADSPYKPGAATCYQITDAGREVANR